MAFRAAKKVRQAIAFGRHLPFRKVLRRLELAIRRHLRDRIPAVGSLLEASALATATAPPRPVFPPRGGIQTDVDGGLTFTVLGSEIKTAGAAIDWSLAEISTSPQLSRMTMHYMEYLEEVDDAVFVDIVEQWIGANPISTPGSWRDAWNSYALSIRVVVWMQQLAIRHSRLDVEIVVRMHASLVLQIRFLVRNLETDLGGNHLIKNIKALIWASSYFEGQEAELWQASALAYLDRELREQVLPDGVHYERSPSYHCQVFADLLESRHVLGSAALDGRLDAALKLMAQATVDLTHPDHRVAQFNDAGLCMTYPPGQCLQVYEKLFGRRPSSQTVYSFPVAGYFGRRCANHYFVADCGRIAPDDLPAHGHGDVLSFEWSVAGQRVFVDQGVYEYVVGDRRNISRAASSHNTLSIDGTDQADFFGSFRCGRRPSVSVRRWESLSDGFVLEGSHDGFSHLPGRPIHVRCFEVSAKSLVIRDRIEGRTNREVRIGYLLHPDVTVEINDNSALLRLKSGERIELLVTAPLRCETAVWWPDMGHEIETQRLVIVANDNAAEIVTNVSIC